MNFDTDQKKTQRNTHPMNILGFESQNPSPDTQQHTRRDGLELLDEIAKPTKTSETISTEYDTNIYILTCTIYRRVSGRTREWRREWDLLFVKTDTLLVQFKPD